MNRSGDGRGASAKKGSSPFHYLYELLNYVYFAIVRASYKWFCHVWTNKNEIERILDRSDLPVSDIILENIGNFFGYF